MIRIENKIALAGGVHHDTIHLATWHDAVRITAAQIDNHSKLRDQVISLRGQLAHAELALTFAEETVEKLRNATVELLTTAARDAVAAD